jgi:outer membrane beta-barrel protein
MRRYAPFVSLLAMTLAVPCGAARAAEPAPANEQVVVPQVDRRDVRAPHIRSNDIELGAFAGSYSAENFGASSVSGLRLGYHVTEDFFFQASYGRTKISDDAFRQILPNGIFPQNKERLTYYDLSMGYNLFPGEVFIGNKYAFVSSVYLIGGVGSTQFLQERHQTLNVGIGMRLLLKDWVALEANVRDHVFALDLLGTRKTTQNYEVSGGLTFFF